MKNTAVTPYYIKRKSHELHGIKVENPNLTIKNSGLTDNDYIFKFFYKRDK